MISFLPNENMWADYLEPCTLYVVPTNGVVKNNGELVMGAGVARQASDMHPGLPKILGDMVLSWGNKPYLLPWNLASLPTKKNWKDDADIGLIITSLQSLGKIIPDGCKTVAMPLPGAGNGNLPIEASMELIKMHAPKRVGLEMAVFYFDDRK